MDRLFSKVENRVLKFIWIPFFIGVLHILVFKDLLSNFKFLPEDLKGVLGLVLRNIWILYIPIFLWRKSVLFDSVVVVVALIAFYFIDTYVFVSWSESFREIIKSNRDFMFLIELSYFKRPFMDYGLAGMVYSIILRNRKYLIGSFVLSCFFFISYPLNHLLGGLGSLGRDSITLVIEKVWSITDWLWVIGVPGVIVFYLVVNKVDNYRLLFKLRLFFNKSITKAQFLIAFSSFFLFALKPMFFPNLLSYALKRRNSLGHAIDVSELEFLISQSDITKLVLFVPAAVFVFILVINIIQAYQYQLKKCSVWVYSFLNAFPVNIFLLIMMLKWGGSNEHHKIKRDRRTFLRVFIAGNFIYEILVLYAAMKLLGYRFSGVAGFWILGMVILKCLAYFYWYSSRKGIYLVILSSLLYALAYSFIIGFEFKIELFVIQLFWTTTFTTLLYGAFWPGYYKVDDEKDQSLSSTEKGSTETSIV